MSQVFAPNAQPEEPVAVRENAAALRAMLRRRKSPARLYWLLERPGPGVYARAVTRLIAYRFVSAVVASLAITLCGFLGAAVGNLGYLRWSAVGSTNGLMASLAVVHADGDMSRLVPAFIMLGLILVSIPRAYLWIFRLTMLIAAVLGYYQRYLPPFWRSAATTFISREALSLTRLTQRYLAASAQGDRALVLAIALLIPVIAYGLYRMAYGLSAATMTFIPHRPEVRGTSAFFQMSLRRRFMAVPVTAGLLAVSVWIVQDIRETLPAARSGVILLRYNQLSAWWLAAAVVVVLMICTPRPRGYRWLLVATLVAIAVYASWSRVHVLRMPNWVPAVPHNFWLLLAIYLLVTGLGFDTVAAQLGWSA
jgi:hypothetical protein